MTLAPFAEWIGPTKNRSAGGMRRPIRGLVLHIMQGTESGSESWLKNPRSQASAHFLNPKVGGLKQLVDTDDRAWAQASGNLSWVSVENEGRSGESLTASQLANVARLLAWLHDTEGVPLDVTDDVGKRGLGWHGMGGKAWGGHPDCPGEPIKNQRPQIVRLAMAITTTPSNRGAAMARFPNAVDACWSPNGGVWVLGSDGGVGAYGPAEFHGSYHDLAPEQRQGDRTFLRIVPSTLPGKAYDILGDDGSHYSFPVA